MTAMTTLFSRARRRALAPAAVALLTLTGCGDSLTPSGTTALSVMLKDAPGDVQAAVVTVSEIDLVGAHGVQALTQTPATVDLLTLAASAMTLVQDAAVPSGTYTALRFKITGACIRVDNGDQTNSIYATTGYDATPCGGPADGTLQAPSFAESGLKVTMAGDALAITGSQKILLVDFNVEQSFGHETGGSGGWVMHPVVTGGDVQSTGSVRASVQLGSGITLPPINNIATTLAQFSSVLVANTSDTIAVVPLTDLDNDGAFTADFNYITPGDYTLSLELPVGLTSVTTNPATPQLVTITSGQELTETFTVTAAN